MWIAHLRSKASGCAWEQARSQVAPSGRARNPTSPTSTPRRLVVLYTDSGFRACSQATYSNDPDTFVSGSAICAWEQARTADPSLFRRMLYQLSYPSKSVHTTECDRYCTYFSNNFNLFIPANCLVKLFPARHLLQALLKCLKRGS